MTATHDVKEGLVGPAWDALAGGARGLTRMLGSAGTGAVSATPVPLRSMLAGVLTSIDQLPSVTAQLEVLMSEVHAQRLSLQAMEAELDALDRQLEVLERALAPASALGHQMSRLRTSLDDVLAVPQVGTEGCGPVDPAAEAPVRRAHDRASSTHHPKEKQQ